MSFKCLLYCALFIYTMVSFVYSTGFHPSISRLDLPLAPYNVKMYCRSGLANKNDSTVPVLCPSASTTCGYFAIPWTEKGENTIIYECIDSSIFMSEEHEGSRDVYYSYLCSHQSRCHKFPLIRLNPQFLNYLQQTYNLNLHELIVAAKSVKFCCSNNHNSLVQLVETNSSMLQINSPLISCDDKQCLAGAVGCMNHKKEKFEEPAQTLSNHDYGDISPVEIVWQDSDLIDEYVTISTMTIEPETHDDDHLHCVYPHFNDEVYRYCLMIKAQQAGSCWFTRGHKICCCFVEENQETCTPTGNQTFVVSTTKSTTTTKAPKIRSFNGRRKIEEKKCRGKECKEKAASQRSFSESFLNTGIYLFSMIILFSQL